METHHVLLLTAALVSGPVFANEPGPATPGGPAAAPPAANTAPAQAITGSVARAQFTSAVQNNEPTDSIAVLENDKIRIYFFTDLKNLAGQKVTHRWEWNGKVMHEQRFDVTSPRYRTFSSKTLDPGWAGEWKVSVIDGGGGTLSANTFSYGSGPTAPAR